MEEFQLQYSNAAPKEAPDVFIAPARDDNYRALPPYRCRVDEATYSRINNSGVGLWSVTVPVDTLEATALLPPNDFMSLAESLM